ncbi:MAG: phenylalanine--tRNA ligase subunit beta, partial [Pseudomonadota bacterium]
LAGRDAVRVGDGERIDAELEIVGVGLDQRLPRAAGLVVDDSKAVARIGDKPLDESVPAQKLIKAVAGADKKLITGVKVFDVFEGASLGEDKKSIALEVELQPTEATLTDEQLDALQAAIVKAGEKVGGVLRG